MKTFILFLLPLVSLAEPMNDPCAGLNCTEKMKAISENYRAGGGIQEGTLGKVFSGQCFHHVWNMNPDTTHHGFALLDPKEGAVYMIGSFSFFAKENPYGTLTPDQARGRTTEPYGENKRLEMHPGYAYVDMNAVDPAMPWKYWIREKDGKLALIGQWGIHQRFFCDLQANP